MRRTTIGIVVTSALVAAGCGGSGPTFANKPRPPVPVELSVYIDNARVSVSPSSVGAGPVTFIVTNQATRTESLTIAPAGSGTSVAGTGPITPQATSQLAVNLASPGEYTVSTGSTGPGSTDTSPATPASMHSAALHIGPKRPSASGVLLQP
jgi:hypothetical protein